MTAPTPLPAEHMITARVRMERKLYERAEAVAKARGQTVAEFVTLLVDDAVETDAANARLGKAEARAA